MEKSIHIENEEALSGIAAKVAPLLRAGDVLCLKGGLGAGKTAFARALIQTLAGALEEVPSPTFTLVQVYDAIQPEVWHFDLYRLESEKSNAEKDILELGWEEARRHAVALVEWPERLGSLLPRDRLEILISIDPANEKARRMTFVPFGRWQQRALF